MKKDTVMGAMINLKASTELIEKALEKSRVSSLNSPTNTTSVSLIPSLSAPFGEHELQEALKKANSGMAFLDAAGLQAETLFYAEDRFFTLYENAVKEANEAQLFLLCSHFTQQKGVWNDASRGMSTSHDLLLSQLCAALRASANGKLSLLVPSVNTPQEIDTARQMIGYAMKKLRARSIPFDEAISLGIVLGTPASLLLSRKLIEAVDLVMIDTDLLTALSLNSTPVSRDFDHLLHENAEAILRLVEIGIGNAHLLGRFVILGGSMVLDPRFLPHFLAMGVNGLAVPPPKLKNVKSLLRKIK